MNLPSYSDSSQQRISQSNRGVANSQSINKYVNKNQQNPYIQNQQQELQPNQTYTPISNQQILLSQSQKSNPYLKISKKASDIESPIIKFKNFQQFQQKKPSVANMPSQNSFSSQQQQMSQQKGKLEKINEKDNQKEELFDNKQYLITNDAQILKYGQLKAKLKDYPELENEEEPVKLYGSQADQNQKEFLDKMEQFQHESRVCVRLGYVDKNKEDMPNFWQRIKNTILLDTIDFKLYGVGFPHFFNFIKYCVFLLIILFLTSGANNLLGNLQGNVICGVDSTISDDCQFQIQSSLLNRQFSSNVYKSYIEGEEVKYKKAKIYDYVTYNYLHIFALLGMSFVLIKLRLTQQDLTKECLSTSIPAQDYTITLKRTKPITQDDINKFDEQQEIIDIQTFIQVQYHVPVSEIVLVYKYDKKKGTKTYVGRSHISLQKKEDQLEIIAEAKKLSKSKAKQFPFQVKGESHEPTDINWRNQGISATQRFWKKLKYGLLDLSVLLGAFLIICWFQHYTDTGKLFWSWNNGIDSYLTLTKPQSKNNQNNLQINQYLSHNHDQVQQNQYNTEQANIFNEFFSSYEHENVQQNSQSPVINQNPLDYTFYQLNHCIDDHYDKDSVSDRTCYGDLLASMREIQEIYHTYPKITLRWFLLMQRIRDLENDTCGFKLNDDKKSEFQQCIKKKLQRQSIIQFPLPFSNLNDCNFEFDIFNEDQDFYAFRYFLENSVYNIAYDKDISTFEKWDKLDEIMDSWYNKSHLIQYTIENQKYNTLNLSINKTVKLDSKLWQCVSQHIEDQLPLNRISYWCDTLFIFPLLIEVLNMLIGMSIEYTTEKTRNLTRTEDISQMAQRNCILEFINSAIGFSFLYCFYPLLVYTSSSLIYWQNLYENEYNKIVPAGLDDFINSQNIRYQMQQPGGLVDLTYNWIMISNLVITPLIYFFGPPDRLINNVIRWFSTRTSSSKKEITPKEAEEYYTAYPYVIHERYAYIINTILVTAFFAAILPISIIFSIGSITIMYCIEKYKLFNFCSIQVPVQENTTLIMCQVLDYFLPIYVIGYTVFSYVSTCDYYIHFAMQNIDKFGKYPFQKWVIFWIQSDEDKDNFKNIEDYETIQMLDSFIQWGILGGLICIAYYILVYIIDYRQKQETLFELDPLTKNEVTYQDAKKLVWDSDYKREQQKFEEDFFYEFNKQEEETQKLQNISRLNSLKQSQNQNVKVSQNKIQSQQQLRFSQQKQQVNQEP